MNPVVHQLLVACTAEDHRRGDEKIIDDILSSSASELTMRLSSILADIRKRSALFSRLQRGVWYIVPPKTNDDFPRCVLGDDLLAFCAVFPDVPIPPGNATKKQLEAFEVFYVRTYFDQVHKILCHRNVLYFARECSDVEIYVLEHALELARLVPLSLFELLQTISSGEERDRIEKQIAYTQKLITFLFAEISKKNKS